MAKRLSCTDKDDIEAVVFTLMEDWLKRLPPFSRRCFLLKPNLVSDYPPPITTPTDIVEAISCAVRAIWPDARIVIGEGTASIRKDTWTVFNTLGYTDLANRHDIQLMDLNESPLVCLKERGMKFFPKIWLPEIVLEATLISIPVLKVHTLSGVTLSMKNMIGLLPPRHYQERGHWKKSVCHRDIHRAIFELNRYRSPDFTVLDARRGMASSHLGGPELTPPPGIILAGEKAWEVDAHAAGLLGRDWKAIDHIYLAFREE